MQIFRVVITGEKHRKKKNWAVTVLTQALWWAPVPLHCKKTTFGILRERTGTSIKTIIFSSQKELQRGPFFPFFN